MPRWIRPIPPSIPQYSPKTLTLNPHIAGQDQPGQHSCSQGQAEDRGAGPRQRGCQEGMGGGGSGRGLTGRTPGSLLQILPSTPHWRNLPGQGLRPRLRNREDADNHHDCCPPPPPCPSETVAPTHTLRSRVVAPVPQPSGRGRPSRRGSRRSSRTSWESECPPHTHCLLMLGLCRSVAPQGGGGWPQGRWLDPTEDSVGWTWFGRVCSAKPFPECVRA